MVLRTATARDLHAVMALWNELVDYHHALDPRFGRSAPEAQEKFRSWMEQGLDDPERLLLVAEHQGHVLGFVHVLIKPTPPVFPRPRTGFVTDLAVSAGHRRGGIGRALVQAVRGWCAEQGLEDLGLGVAVRNPAGLAFWSAMGFEAWTQTMVQRLSGPPEGATRDTT